MIRVAQSSNSKSAPALLTTLSPQQEDDDLRRSKLPFNFFA
jgi:hypothetical protein